MASRRSKPRRKGDLPPAGDLGVGGQPPAPEPARERRDPNSPGRRAHPKKGRPKPPAALSIIQYFHCRQCVSEVLDIARRTEQPQSPATYSRYDVGFTEIGLQIWCRRHEINLVHIDFEGQQHPANRAGTDTKGDT